MLKQRIIPCLLLDGTGLVKTTKFCKPEYIGDPINAIRIFNEKEVDELIVLDIFATKENRDPNFLLIEQFASECFMPLAYGGGIRSIEQARQLFTLGVEKVCLQTAVLDNISLITKFADQFGSQSVLVSIDIKQNWTGKRQLYSASTGKSIAYDWVTFLTKVVAAGAGEIVLNSVDRDGTMRGMDIELISIAAKEVGVPIIAMGGAGCLADFKSAVKAGASAVAAGAYFVYYGPHRAVLITYPMYADLEELFGKQVGNIES